MAADLSSPTYAAWGLDKPSIEPESRSSSESFDNAEEKMRIVRNMADFRAALDEKETKVVFHKEYLSSEEALSPIEPEMEIPDDHQTFIQEEIDDMNLDEEIIKAIRHSIFEMAVQVPIRVVGRPSIVDIPPSPAMSSAPASRQHSKNDKDKKRPTLKTRFSATSFAELSSPSSGENSPYRPSTAYSKYRLDSASEGSSPDQNSCTQTPVTLKKPPQAAFIFADPFATGYGSSATALNDVINQYCEPTTPSTIAPTIKPRHERLKTLSNKISSLGKRSKAPEVPPKQERRQSIPSLSLSPSSSVSSRKFPKLEARGAAERSPTIEIPPCPYDTDDDHVAPASPKAVYRKPSAPHRLRSASLLALSDTLRQTKVTLV